MSEKESLSNCPHLPNGKTMYELMDEAKKYRIENEIGVLVKYDQYGNVYRKIYPPGFQDAERELNRKSNRNSKEDKRTVVWRDA